jgi:hypothetical protein
VGTDTDVDYFNDITQPALFAFREAGLDTFSFAWVIGTGDEGIDKMGPISPVVRPLSPRDW